MRIPTATLDSFLLAVEEAAALVDGESTPTYREVAERLALHPGTVSA